MSDKHRSRERWATNFYTQNDLGKSHSTSTSFRQILVCFSQNFPNILSTDHLIIIRWPKSMFFHNFWLIALYSESTKCAFGSVYDTYWTCSWKTWIITTCDTVWNIEKIVYIKTEYKLAICFGFFSWNFLTSDISSNLCILTKKKLLNACFI